MNQRNTVRSLIAIAFGMMLGAPLAHGQSADELQTRDEAFADLRRQADLVEKNYSLLKRVVKLTNASVVHIQANKTTRSSNNALTRVEEAGAGVILKYSGQHYVVTNRHVIADAQNEQIRIQLVDGRFFSPVEVRSDPESDIAVMFIEEDDLDSVEFGNSDSVEIGDFVVAIGSPFGLSHSVSYGIISAMGRRDLELGTQGVRFQDFLQTDAAINPGNSGGPLLNLRGEVIGINTAIASNSGGNDGIGFTIPSNMVERVARHLINYGRVRRGFVGVTLDARYTPEKAKSIGLNTAFGARISGISPNSPASKTDLRHGDVILSYDGVQIVNDSHLVSEVSNTEIGKTVPLMVFRNGQKETIEVTIQERRTPKSDD